MRANWIHVAVVYRTESIESKCGTSNSSAKPRCIVFRLFGLCVLVRHSSSVVVRTHALACHRMERQPRKIFLISLLLAAAAATACCWFGIVCVVLKKKPGQMGCGKSYAIFLVMRVRWKYWKPLHHNGIPIYRVREIVVFFFSFFRSFSLACEFLSTVCLQSENGSSSNHSEGGKKHISSMNCWQISFHTALREL